MNENNIFAEKLEIITPNEELAVRRYVNQNYFDQEVFIDYLNNHDIINFDIFEESLKQKEHVHWTFLSAFKSLKRSIFIKRIKIYFFDLNCKDSVPISMSDFFDGYYRYTYGIKTHNTTELISFEPSQLLSNEPIYKYSREVDGFEKLYNIIDDFENSFNILPEDMLRYLFKQTGDVKNFATLLKWYNYLKMLPDEVEINLYPKNIYYAYNKILVENNKQPIIYYPAKIREFENEKDVAFKVNNNFIIGGFFPCDDEGNPATQWIAIWAENTGEPTTLQSTFRSEDGTFLDNEPELRTTLKFQLNNDSKIFIGKRKVEKNDEFNAVTDVTEYWQQVYAGPKVMELDCNAITSARIKQNLSPKDIADATDINMRTYQRIESGEVKTDALNLLKILNFLNIDSYEDVIKKDIIMDNGFEKFKTGKNPSEFIESKVIVISENNEE